MVIVGLHPNCDIEALQRQCLDRKSEDSGSGKFRSVIGYQNQSRVEPNVEPQVVSGTSTNFAFINCITT
jgi:hypothetical protein